MRLFVAEKPSVARAIAAVLPGPQKRHKTHIESGESNLVVWCAGHILSPLMPEEYDARFEQWRLEDLPIVPAQWQMRVNERTQALYETIERFAGEAALIVHAGDPDREGQLLVDEVLERIGVDVPVKRMLVADLNAAAVKRALGRLQDNTDFQGLRDAAEGRMRADWLFGLNLTRLYTVHARESGHSGVLSVGRVQTPVLGLVVRRDREIDGFEPHPYYTLSATFRKGEGRFKAHWRPGEGCGVARDAEGRVTDRAYVETVKEAVLGKTGTVSLVKTQARREEPPLPFNLSELQKVAHRCLGLSPRQTLDVAQGLYENHQVLTYPRSDCRYLPVDHWTDAGVIRDTIVNSVGQGHPVAEMAEAVSLVERSRCWDDTKVTAHHAIIPTGRWVPSRQLTDVERWIYTVVAHRYLLQFAGTREYDQTDVVVEIQTDDGVEQFAARGHVDTRPGWSAYRGLLKEAAATPDSTQGEASEDDAGSEDDAATKPLPRLAEGDQLDCDALRLSDKHTSPPKRFTEATLLDAMTGIARFVEDPEIRQVLKDTDGLGTPATQAGIIEILHKRGYIETSGKSLKATALGHQLIDSLPEDVSRPDITAKWEMELSRISGGEAHLSTFMASVCGMVEAMTALGRQCTPMEFAGAGETRKPSRSKTYPCPAEGCQGVLRKVKSKGGLFWGCTAYKDGCRETRPDQRGRPARLRRPGGSAFATAGSTCPTCKKGKIQKRTMKNGKNAGKPFYGCSRFPQCRHFTWTDTATEAES